MPTIEVTSDFYVIDGIEYPRVTRVLDVIDKPGLSRWRGGVGNKEADRVSTEGREIGKRFHDSAQEINLGMHRNRGWIPPEDLRPMLMNYRDWLHENVSAIISAERFLVSSKKHYAGTADLVAIMKGDDMPSVLDLKTSNQPSSEWPLQLSAYKMALAEEGVYTMRRIIVRIPKKSPHAIETFQYHDHEGDSEAWLAALDIWRWKQGDKLRHKTPYVSP